MFRALNFVFLTFVMGLSGCQSNAANTTNITSTNSFQLTNINVIDVAAGQILFGQSVCVEEGVIQEVSFERCSTNNAPVIDGKNGFLTPGLIDMHVHMYEKQGLAFSLSHGVTHVRMMNGVSAQLKWRDDVAAGRFIGSSASVSSPIISGYENAIVHHGLATAQDAINAVRTYHQQGYDLLKVYGNLNTAAFNALVNESRRLGLPIAKHGPSVPGKLNILDFNDIQSFEHAENIFYDALDRQFSLKGLIPFIAEIKQLDTPITPTLNVFDQLTQLSSDKEAFLEQMPTHYISTIVKLEDEGNQIKRWLGATKQQAAYNKKALNFLKQIVKALYDADVPLLIGSDSGVLLSPHGLATHNEMALFYDAGVDTFSILKYATVNAATALGLSTKIGQIKAGFNADFIYTQDNPIQKLSVLRNPDAVIKYGKWHSRSGLQSLRDQAVASKSLWSELKLFSEMITR